MATPMKMQHTYHEQVEILVGVCIFFSATTTTGVWMNCSI